MSTLTLTQQAAPPPPVASKHILYIKSDGLIYSKDSAGVESKLSPAGNFMGGGGANGRIYYPQNSVASSLAGYKVASLTPSAGVTSNVSIACPTQNAYVLGEEFATLVGEPNALSLPAGTAIRFLFASITGGSAQIQSDLFQYKTTGDVATTGAISLVYADNGAAADTITRSAGSFITDGFTAGCRITPTGTVNNNGSFTVQTVAALSLTLILSDALVAETVSSTVTTKEKLLRTSASPEFTNTTPQLLQFFYTDPLGHVLAADDRIIFKWWGRRTTAGGSQTIAIGTEGLTSASYIQTTLPVNGSIVNITGTIAQFNAALTDGDFLTNIGYTVATLPVGVVGDRAYVTDAVTPAYNTALTGGGTVRIPVFRNATVWVSA